MNLKLPVAIMGLICSLVATMASAGFAVSEYQSQEPYGNGQVPCFRGAITGGHRALSSEEETRILASLPLKETGRFYGRFSVNSGAMRFSSIKNKITNTTAFPNGTVTTQKVRQNQTGLELALGYFYTNNMRFELEFLINKNFNYSSTPALTGVPGTAPAGRLDAELKNNTLLFNGYYESTFGGYDRFHPFVTAGVGISHNSVRSGLTPAGIRGTKRKGSMAIGAGVGFRFMVFQRVALVASMRYLNLGTAIVQPMPIGLQLSGNYNRIPVSLGLFYLF